jgi:Spy/CpxP family protein refolding chaperone
MKKKLIAGILAMALVATAFAVGAAQTNSNGPAPRGTGGSCSGPCNMSQLTDEQKQAIEDQLQEYEQELLKDYGIVLTDEQMDALQQAIQEQMQESRQNQFGGPQQNQFGPHNCTMTDEELEEMKAQRESEREARQQKMQELLEQYGINLTNEEWQELQEQLREYRQELLGEYGISCPCEPLGAGAENLGQNSGMGQGMQGFRRGPGFGECAQSYCQNQRS